MIVDLHPRLHIDDLVLLSKCNDPGIKKGKNKDIAKMILTHILKRWDQNKTQSHPSSTALTEAEHVSLKVCNIVLN